MTKICGTCGLMGEMHDSIFQHQRLLQICQKHNLLPGWLSIKRSSRCVRTKFIFFILFKNVVLQREKNTHMHTTPTNGYLVYVPL